MPADKRLFDIKKILDQLRLRVGDSEFGYRMQAFFAHVLMRLNSKIKAINNQGHPDITAEIDSAIYLIQVKTISHNTAESCLLVTSDDLDGIYPNFPKATGYYAVLDCSAPVTWLICRHEKIRKYVLRPIDLEMIRLISDQAFSQECTDIFADMIISNFEKLPLLTYGILRDRALRGDCI